MNRRAFQIQAVAVVASLFVGLISAQAEKVVGSRGRPAGRSTPDTTVPTDLQSEQDSPRTHKPDALPDCPDNTLTARLAYVSEGLDLDNDSIYKQAVNARSFNDDVDLSLAYDPDSRPHLSIIPEMSASAGVFARAFDDVTCEDVMMISFAPASDETPVGLDDTIVLYTAEGTFYKVGNFVERSGGTVQFDYVELCVACEPEAVDVISTDPDADETIDP
jgi:hypothetical protein